MKHPVAVTVLTLCLFSSFQTLALPEVWLLSGKHCNICELFDEVSENRGYGDVLNLDGTHYPIHKIDKAALPGFLKQALAEDISHRHWGLQLTVAVVDNQTLLYQGNIAQSADFSQASLKHEYMFPKRDVTLEELHSYGFNYLAFFKQQFNLEYFVEVALNQRAPRQNNELELHLTTGNSQKNAHLSIWGSAMQPANNGLFIATRINQLLQTFENDDPWVVFGHGKGADEFDTLILRDDKYTFVKAPVKADFSAGVSGLEQWFSALKNGSGDNHLIIQVGHSGPNGSPVWGHPLPLNKPLLAKTLDETGKNTVFVSGSCHGGLFAGAASCGFFAAHPDAIATGCQTSLSAIDSSDDYLKFFFGADPQRDINGDTEISFSEAHWFASTRLEHHNISYTDKDAAVDEYFLQYPERLPSSVLLGELKKMASVLSTDENYALRTLAADLSDNTIIDLKDHVARHKSAIDLLKGKTELSSTQRNEITALDYPLNLVMLVRRAIFAEQEVPFSKSLETCENGSIAGFIR